MGCLCVGLTPTTGEEGEEVDVAVCINPDRSLEGDDCGCCGMDCPELCKCKRMMEMDDAEDEEGNPGDFESDSSIGGGGRGRGCGHGRGRGHGGHGRKRRGVELVVDGNIPCVDRVSADGLLTGDGDVSCSTSCLEED